MLKFKKKQAVIIAVLYNTYFEACNFLESLCKFQNEDILVLIADNSEIKPTKEFEELVNNNVSIFKHFRLNRNLGYFGAAKFLLDEYLKENSIPNWIIISNVDVKINQKDFFTVLFSKFNETNNDIIAPQIWSMGKQCDLNPKMVSRPKKNKIILLNIISYFYIIQQGYEILSFVKYEIKKYIKHLNKKINWTRNILIPKEDMRNIYAPHGSFIIFKNTYFQKGGTINHISFLFGEEIFIGETAIENNLSVLYDPSLIVLDSEHASTGIMRNKLIAKFMKESTKDLYKKYFA